MAVTVPDPTPDSSGAVAQDLDALTADPGNLDGHTIEQLAEYVDRGRKPLDESIEQSPSCRRAIAALERLRVVSTDFLADDDGLPPVDEAWLGGVMRRIAQDARAGDDFVLVRTGEGDEVVMTEGALRALIRGAGDEQPGFLVGRVRFTGDLSEPAGPIVITVDVVVGYGVEIPDGVERLRAAVLDRLRRHTLIASPRIDVVVRDLTAPEEA